MPGGVNLLHLVMAGLPIPATTIGGLERPQEMGDPIYTPSSGGFEIDKWPADYWSTTLAHFPNAGILGAPDYTGGWTAEVDFVNWYLNNTGTRRTGPIGGSDGLMTLFDGRGQQWYPVVPGLLMGESYHIIPGTTAKSGISLTEDGALNPYSLGHTMAANHLGPYSQEGVWH